MSFPKVSIVLSQRFFPQACVHRSSARADSQVGTWIPLATDPTGMSSCGQCGKSGSKSCRLIFRAGDSHH